jgi:MYXO-CTERM domain-containing protein
VLIQGTQVLGSGATVDVSGGTGAAAGGGGRFLLGDNTSSSFSGSVLGAASTLNAAGSVDNNPFIAGSPLTPFIPNLPSIGAEIYGLTGLSASSLIGSLPATDINGASLAGASGALFRTSASVIGPAFTGYDALLFINLTGNAFNSPEFTLGGTLENLQNRGFANNPAFGGSGPVLVGSLNGDAVYATLVPTGTDANPSIQVTSSTSGFTFNASGAAIDNGQALYVAPEPSSVAMALFGAFGLALAAWRRRKT